MINYSSKFYIPQIGVTNIQIAVDLLKKNIFLKIKNKFKNPPIISVGTALKNVILITVKHL